MNILIAGHEKINLRITQELIQTHITDSHVFLCSSPDEIAPKMKEYNIDIVLLEIIIPQIKGINILKNIRSKKEYNDIQIIILTEIIDKEVFKLCFENGANDYIYKPIDLIEFVARMNASIKARRNIIALQKTNDTVTTQYKKLQAMTHKLKDTQFNLIQKEKLTALGEIAAGIAHEINNPMGFISSNLDTMNRYIQKIRNLILLYRNFVQLPIDANINHELLLREKAAIADIEQKQKIDFVLDDLTSVILESRDGVERVTKIVQSLINLAKTGTENEIAYNDLSQIAEEALLIVKHETKCIADIDKQIEVPLYLFCNKGQIGQVILNILLNAIHAVKNQSRKSMGKITIKAYHADEYVMCKISDDGPGIKKEHRNRIFDPFFTTKDVGSGVGLGLSVAYDIVVKNHGGELTVDSEPGSGTSFTIKLPANSGKIYNAEE